MAVMIGGDDPAPARSVGIGGSTRRLARRGGTRAGISPTATTDVAGSGRASFSRRSVLAPSRIAVAGSQPASSARLTTDGGADMASIVW